MDEFTGVVCVEEIIAIRAMKNAGRSSRVSKQVLLTEEVKDKIPALRS